jgi:molybdopterin synthase catalytic subunit
MHIRVLFFGVLKDLSGRATETLDLPERSTLGDLLNHCAATTPELEQHLPGIAMSINQQFARASDILKTGDEVALLPPVSGGSDASTRGPHCAMIREPIDTAAIAHVLKRPEDGATAIFEGIVRNNTRGRQTLYLVYESYEAMALKKMEELALQALAEFKIRDVKLVHRLGRLEIGETSVLIVVASAHRGPAFDACRWLIDTLKRTVPIWKKEYFIDGAVWADGEPFPPEIATQPAPASPEAQAAQSPHKASH